MGYAHRYTPDASVNNRPLSAAEEKGSVIFAGLTGRHDGNYDQATYYLLGDPIRIHLHDPGYVVPETHLSPFKRDF